MRIHYSPVAFLVIAAVANAGPDSIFIRGKELTLDAPTPAAVLALRTAFFSEQSGARSTPPGRLLEGELTADIFMEGGALSLALDGASQLGRRTEDSEDRGGSDLEPGYIEFGISGTQVSRKNATIGGLGMRIRVPLSFDNPLKDRAYLGIGNDGHGHLALDAYLVIRPSPAAQGIVGLAVDYGIPRRLYHPDETRPGPEFSLNARIDLDVAEGMTVFLGAIAAYALPPKGPAFDERPADLFSLEVGLGFEFEVVENFAITPTFYVAGDDQGARSLGFALQFRLGVR